MSKKNFSKNVLLSQHRLFFQRLKTQADSTGYADHTSDLVPAGHLRELLGNKSFIEWRDGLKRYRFGLTWSYSKDQSRVFDALAEPPAEGNSDKIFVTFRVWKV